jgi:cytochrome d ubiquinol oxidase subunit II
MSLAEAPIVLVLAGLAAYAVLAGADFGAGFWQLTPGQQAKELREHAHHAIGPVWEANHVWLIFVLVVTWTAYPEAFGSIASTLAIPLFIAGIGIVLRGTAYALRSGTKAAGEQRAVEVAFGASSILTPFALGAVVGGIASGRVPVGNARGDLVTSWLNPTSIAIGVIAVAAAAYLAAVYLVADAARLGSPTLVHAYRIRALVMGAVAGAAAVAGLVVVRYDATRIWDGLTSGAGLAAVLVSGLAGVATVLLVARQRYGWARVSGALAVTAVIAGWGLAQRPELLPGLTIDEAAAGRSTLVSMLVALALGAFLLVPALVFLFGLVLRGRFEGPEHEPALPRITRVRGGDLLLRAALVCFGVGATLMIVFDSSWSLVTGVIALLASVGLGYVSLASLAATADEADDA